jgi:hypothetical protein
MTRRYFWIPLILSALSAPGVRAQGPETIRLTVHPAAAPVPALTYQFLPDGADVLPGNAALFYQRAYSPEWLSHRSMPKIGEKLDAWKKAPLKELPVKEMAWLATYLPLRELDYAVRHEMCDWDLRDRVRKEGIRLLLPDLQGFREFANLLAARARLEMAEHRSSDAVFTLQTGFKLARDVGEGPTLIHLLVGLNSAQAMAEQVETLIEQADCPNLYWALTVLPRPFVSYRKPLLGEKVLIESLWPNLHDLETTVMTPQQVEAQLIQARRSMGEAAWAETFGSSGLADKAIFAMLVAKTYPAAKAALIKKRRRSDEVESMPALQVVLLYSFDEYRRHRDAVFCWADVPFWQALPGLHRADEELRAARASGSEGLPIASSFVPAVGRVFDAGARADRRIAALRCIEAVRLYAAGHDGKVPALLDDVTVVPIPLDPMNGKAFEYQADGNKFTLRGPVPPGAPASPNNTLQYEVTVTGAGQ